MEKTLTVKNGEFTHMCSGCRKVRKVKFTKKLARVKLKCNCGYLSIVPLNYRGQFRLPTNIAATITIDAARARTCFLNKDRAVVSGKRGSR